MVLLYILAVPRFPQSTKREAGSATSITGNYNNYDNYGIKNTDKNCTVSDKPFSSKLLCLTYLTKAIKQLHLEQVMQLNLDF